MKVVDYINRAINSYPSLYMCDDYGNSAFAVLHQCFIVLGNGIEWAHTGNPKTGGYLTHPRHRRRYGDWVRIKDKPYGKEKCELDPRVFKEKIFYFTKIDKIHNALAIGNDSIVVFESELEELKKKYNVSKDMDKCVSGFHTHYSLLCERYNKGQRNNPYPYFGKSHSCFWEIEPELIQEDWRIAGIEHLKYWQIYFNDEERVKGYHYYKKPESLKKFILDQYMRQPERYPDWIQAVRDGYEVQEFDGANFEELAAIRWERDLRKTKEFLSETIARLESV